MSKTIKKRGITHDVQNTNAKRKQAYATLAEVLNLVEIADNVWVERDGDNSKFTLTELGFQRLLAPWEL